MQTTQTDLLKAIRDSDNREAWGAFYNIYAPMIASFTRRLGVESTDADDVSQDVMMIAQRSVRDGVFDPAKGRFRAWLYGIARKRSWAMRRARQRPTRAQSVPHGDGVDLLGSVEDQSDAAERAIWEQEWRYALLDEALRQLQSQYGKKALRAFELYGVQHVPADQVANELGIGTASVYAYKNRVMCAIKKWVAQFEDDSEAQ